MTTTRSEYVCDLEKVQETLDHYADMARRALLAYLPDKEPRRYLYDLLRAYPLRGGAGFRPALCIAACRAVGGAAADALDAAVALELLHTAFLVHDDVEDGSERRRGEPTLHVLHGVPLAVNAGDALAFLSLKPLFRTVRGKERLAVALLDEFELMLSRTLEGQATELGWVQEDVFDVTVEDYLRMILYKTSWYTAVTPCRAGVLIGSAGLANLSSCTRYGFLLGALFQIRDDLRSLLAEGTANEDVGDDIREGKRTLLTIHLLAHASPEEQCMIRQVLGSGNGRKDREDVDLVVEMMQKYGSIAFARRCCEELAKAAQREVEVAFADVPDSDDKWFIEQLPAYLVAVE